MRKRSACTCERVTGWVGPYLNPFFISSIERVTCDTSLASHHIQDNRGSHVSSSDDTVTSAVWWVGGDVRVDGLHVLVVHLRQRACTLTETARHQHQQTIVLGPCCRNSMSRTFWWYDLTVVLTPRQP